MKKKYLALLTLILSSLLILSGCSSEDKTPAHYLADLKSVPADMSGYTAFTKAVHQYRKLTMKEANRIFAEGGSGVLYYGYETCPWCNQIVPVLNEVAEEFGQTVYYVDMHNQDGNDEEIYNQFIEYVKEHLQKDEDGEPVLFVPQVFVVKNGKIVAEHLSAVDSYSPSQGNLNASQKKELKKIYTKMLKKLEKYPAPSSQPQASSQPEVTPEGTPESSAVPEVTPTAAPEASPSAAPAE